MSFQFHYQRHSTMKMLTYWFSAFFHSFQHFALRCVANKPLFSQRQATLLPLWNFRIAYINAEEITENNANSSSVQIHSCIYIMLKSYSSCLRMAFIFSKKAFTALEKVVPPRRLLKKCSGWIHMKSTIFRRSCAFPCKFLLIQPLSWKLLW